MSEIKQGKNKFYFGENENTPQAEITYQKDANGNLIVDHTLVSDDLRGQGVAGKLVEAVINYAKQEGVKLVPECSYAKRYIDKHDMNEILA